MSAVIQQLEQLVASHSLENRERYAIRFADSERDRLKAFRLRFKVFNLELNEGLQSAYEDGYDRDPFDDVCQHLIVEDQTTGNVVGTYRMQTGGKAVQHRGYYSEREFDFTPYEKIRGEVLELGRACIHREHRSFAVLNLLWKGIAQYALSTGSRYLLGCSSLTSQDAADGWSVFDRLQKSLCDPSLQTNPRPAFQLSPVDRIGRQDPPKLLRAYMAIGAKICGPPAIDREFKTIDFLTLLDLRELPSSVKARYLGRS